MVEQEHKQRKRRSPWIRKVAKKLRKMGVGLKVCLGTIIFLFVGLLCLIIGFGCSIGWATMWNNVWGFLTGPSGLYWFVIILIALLVLVTITILLWHRDQNRRDDQR